jgi:hypothetical protein
LPGGRAASAQSEHYSGGDDHPLRAPFTSDQGTQARRNSRRRSVAGAAARPWGKLVTCPFCTSVWVATGFSAGLIYLPRTTRIAMGRLAVLAGAGMLQFVHAWLEKLPP